MLDTSELGGGASDSSDTLTATFKNRRLISRLRAFIRSENGQTRLGDEAFTAGLPAQKHLLRALFCADATFVGDTLQLFNPNLGFIQDLQLLLLGFGVQSAIVEGSESRVQASADAQPAATPFLNPEPQSLHHDLSEGGAFADGELPDRQANCPRLGRGDAETRRHGLRIDPGSLRLFSQHIGLLSGGKLDSLNAAVASPAPRLGGFGNYDRVASLTPLGRQQVFDITEPATSSFVANGITVHNCSEYMFLDDTACNLASLNVLTFFDPEARRFDVEGYKHGIRLWTIVLEISVLMASFPSEEIARLSYHYRTLGLGYANLARC